MNKYRNNIGKVRINLYDSLFVVLLLMIVCFFAVTPFRNSIIRHIFVFAGSILIYFIELYQVFKWRLNRGEFFRFTIIGVILLFGLVFTSLNYFDVVYAYLDFLTLFLVLSIRIRHDFRINVTKTIYHFSLIIAFLFIITCFSPAAYVFEDGRSTQALVLGMTNPNLTGMMITCVIELLMINYRERKHKLLLALLVASLFYITWLTGARSSIIPCILVVIYALFFTKWKIPNILIYLILIFSLVFVPVYMFLYKFVLSNVQIMGKLLFSGREITYVEYLNKLNTSTKWVFGDLGGTIFTNAHNAPLMILCSIGIVGLIITYWSFAKNLIEINNSSKNSINRVAIACVFSVCIQSCGEALMFSGVFPGIGFMYIFMLLASQDFSNKNNEII